MQAVIHLSRVIYIFRKFAGKEIEEEDSGERCINGREKRSPRSQGTTTGFEKGLGGGC